MQVRKTRTPISEDLTVEDVELMIRIARERAAVLEDFVKALDEKSLREIVRLGHLLSGGREVPADWWDGVEVPR